MSTYVALPFAPPTLKIASTGRLHGSAAPTGERPGSGSGTCTGLCFQALQRAYEAFGGSVSSYQLVQKLRVFSDQPISIVAHWIVDRDIILFSRQGHTLVPNFQFSGAQFARRPEVASIISELRSALDDWELASWFVTPNTWLDEALPASLINSDAKRVYEAARVDRFVACG